MAELKQGFPPILGESPRLLVLGSMPSEASLRDQQYYAHPRNAFWPIMAQLFGWPTDLPYPERTRALADRRIALWDVIGTCARKGSADSAIDTKSLTVNPIADLLATQPTIQAVLFNGGTAAREFRRRIWPDLSRDRQQLAEYQLPSTSPAMARLSLGQKTDAWRIILDLLGSPPAAGGDPTAGDHTKRPAALAR